MPAAAIAAEPDSRNLRRENRSLVVSSLMVVPIQNTKCFYTPWEIGKSKMWCVEFLGIDVSNEETTRANRARALNSLGKSFGGRDRGRTGDLIVANDALSQLSYSPTSSE